LCMCGKDGRRWKRTPARAGRRGVLAGCCWLVAAAGWAGAASMHVHSIVPPIVPVVDQQQPAHVVTGTLAMLDLTARKGMLKTDLGKPIFFDVGRPDQFSRLSIGDRVTVQLDDEGRTIKVIEALPAEVHEPPPAPAP